MSEAKGPYYFTQPDNDGFAYVFARGNPDWIFAYDTENRSENARFAGDACSHINHALAAQAERVKELEGVLRTVFNATGALNKLCSIDLPNGWTAAQLIDAALTPPAKGNT